MLLCSMFRLFNGFNGGAEGSLWKDLFMILFTVDLLHDETRFIHVLYSGRVPLLTVSRSAKADQINQQKRKRLETLTT